MSEWCSLCAHQPHGCSYSPHPPHLGQCLQAFESRCCTGNQARFTLYPEMCSNVRGLPAEQGRSKACYGGGIMPVIKGPIEESTLSGEPTLSMGVGLFTPSLLRGATISCTVTYRACQRLPD